MALPDNYQYQVLAGLASPTVASEIKTRLDASFDVTTYCEHMEDFLGDAGDTLPIPWEVDEGASTNSTLDYVTDSACGIYSLILSSDSEAQNVLLWSNDLWINMSKNPIIEARLKINFAGSNFSADQRFVFGLGSDLAAAENTLDDVTTNCWFRIEGANLNILVEADDASTDDDDNDSTIDIVDDTYTVFKIDCSDLADIKFYVDGVQQLSGTITMAALAANTMVQPIICMQRDAGTEQEKVYVDYVHVVQER